MNKYAVMLSICGDDTIVAKLMKVILSSFDYRMCVSCSFLTVMTVVSLSHIDRCVLVAAAGASASTVKSYLSSPLTNALVFVTIALPMISCLIAMRAYITFWFGTYA